MPKYSCTECCYCTRSEPYFGGGASGGPSRVLPSGRLVFGGVLELKMGDHGFLCLAEIKSSLKKGLHVKRARQRGKSWLTI